MLGMLHRLFAGMFFLSPRVPPSGLHHNRLSFARVLYALACGDYILRFFRFWVVGIPVLLWSAFHLFLFLRQTPPGQPHVLLAAFFGVFVIFWERHVQRLTRLKAAEFLRQHPAVHPETFFRRYKLELAFGNMDFFSQNNLVNLPLGSADFRRGRRPEKKILPLFSGIFDTITLAQMCLVSLRFVGPRYLFDVFDAIACQWGKLLLRTARGALTVSGGEMLEGKSGRFILVFNHRSAFDFILTFLALSEIRVANRILRPRFILARDHFKDNPLIYRLIGVGEACEAAQMVFISRKMRQKSFEDLNQAARFIGEKNIDAAIYPQGTRASGNYDRSMKRRDAGFYTTISRHDPAGPLSHVKKGTAYLVWDTLEHLAQRGDKSNLNVVFIGIKGTGVTLPKGSLKVQTENKMEFVIGHVLTLSPDLAADVKNDEGVQQTELRKKIFVTEMNQAIHENLKSAIAYHPHLLQRYLAELKGQFHYDDDKIHFIENRILELERQSDIVYQTMDRIYSLPIREWNGYLSQMAQLLLEKSEVVRFMPLLEEVSLQLLKKK